MNKPEISHGNKHWKNDKGQFHREDGPAIEWNGGRKYWYLNGQLHREGGPAVENADGTKFWYLNGRPHQEGLAVGHRETRPTIKTTTIPSPNLSEILREGRARDLQAYKPQNQKLDFKKVTLGVVLLFGSLGSLLYYFL